MSDYDRDLLIASGPTWSARVRVERLALEALGVLECWGCGSDKVLTMWEFRGGEYRPVASGCVHCDFVMLVWSRRGEWIPKRTDSEG